MNRVESEYMRGNAQIKCFEGKVGETRLTLQQRTIAADSPVT